MDLPVYHLGKRKSRGLGTVEIIGQPREIHITAGRALFHAIRQLSHVFAVNLRGKTVLLLPFPGCNTIQTVPDNAVPIHRHIAESIGYMVSQGLVGHLVGYHSFFCGKPFLPHLLHLSAKGSVRGCHDIVRKGGGIRQSFVRLPAALPEKSNIQADNPGGCVRILIKDP